MPAPMFMAHLMMRQFQFSYWFCCEEHFAPGTSSTATLHSFSSKCGDPHSMKILELRSALPGSSMSCLCMLYGMREGDKCNKFSPICPFHLYQFNPSMIQRVTLLTHTSCFDAREHHLYFIIQKFSPICPLRHLSN